MRRRLRIFTGEEQSPITTPEPAMTIPLGELAQILADAVISRRTWLEDFSDETVAIPADLHEVLMAYRRLRTGA